MKLLVFDPGLDVTGWAVFDEPVGGVTIEERIAPALRAWGRFETEPSVALGLRLHQLGADARYLVAVWTGVDGRLQLVAEQPARKAVYQRNVLIGAAAMHQGLAKLHMAAGALIAAGPRAPAPILVRTPRTPKPRKSQIATAILTRWGRLTGRAVPRTIEDERDAIFLGAWWLLEGCGRWKLQGVGHA